MVRELVGPDALVRMRRTSMCASCRKCGPAATDPAMELLVLARNPLGAQPGQWVRVEMDPRRALTAAILVYGVPLLGALIGCLGGWVAAHLMGVLPPDVWLAVGLIAGFGKGVWVLRLLDRRATARGDFKPEIKEIVS